jgi:hypothetical protein
MHTKIMRGLSIRDASTVKRQVEILATIPRQNAYVLVTEGAINGDLSTMPGVSPLVSAVVSLTSIAAADSDSMGLICDDIEESERVRNTLTLYHAPSH